MVESELLVQAINPDVVSIILGGGGLAFLIAIGQGIRWIIDRASAREDKVEHQTRSWQRITFKRLTWESKQHDWWRNYAAQCEGVIIRRLGEDALPKKRPYPREPLDDDDDLKAVEP